MAKIKNPVSIRFVGPDVETNGVPISELGEALIAIQRIVHKSYLISAGKQFRSAVISGKQRKRLALQIAGRERGSDMFLLDWLTQDVLAPMSAELLAGVILLMGKAAGAYVGGGLVKKLQELRMSDDQTEDRQADELALRLYNDIQDLVNRIGLEETVVKKGEKENRKITGIEKIELHFAGVSKPVVLDSDVRDYVRNIKGERVFGEKEKILCRVDEAHTLKRTCVEARLLNDNSWVKVCMDDDMFNDLITHLTDPDQHDFEFTGRAVYRVGRAIHYFNEFETTQFKPI